MEKQKGVVLIFCLAMLMLLSLYALTAMEKSRLLHKQVAAYSQSKQLQYLTELTLTQAISDVKQGHRSKWSEALMSVNSASGWSPMKLPEPYKDIAQADYYVQSLGPLTLSGQTPKVSSSDNSVSIAEADLYRITAKVHLYNIYSRIFEVDYVNLSSD